MALAGCPDYFLHHPNYQVKPSIEVSVLPLLKQWSQRSFQVQQGTADYAVMTPRAESAWKTCTNPPEPAQRGLIASAQQFPRVLWHVRMPFVAMALPWCRTADMQSGGCCYLYPGYAVSPLSIFDSACLLTLSNMIPFV